MPDLNEVQSPIETDLLVVFSDLANFARVSRNIPDMELFQIMANYAEFAGETIEAGGGKVVKFIGDAVLAVFPEEKVDMAAQALIELKKNGDIWWEERGHSCRHIIKAHFGTVVCGQIGTRSEKRFDIYGQAVNIAAALRSHGMAFSPQAFRKLGNQMRKLFKKHTLPVTYIGTEEGHCT